MSSGLIHTLGAARLTVTAVFLLTVTRLYLAPEITGALGNQSILAAQVETSNNPYIQISLHLNFFFCFQRSPMKTKSFLLLTGS